MSKTQLPEDSILIASLNEVHYQDCYSKMIFDPELKITKRELGISFFSSGPRWMNWLFNLRNWIVKFFGLKTPDKKLNREEALRQFRGEVGEKMGFFKVMDSQAHELILGEDDKHLNFRVSLHIAPQSNDDGNRLITVSTIVQFHNRSGKFYFAIVRPFHRIIVQVMLKGMIRKLK